MKIFDLNGKVIKQGQLLQNSTTISLEGFGSGVYFVQLQYGNEMETHKIFIN